MADHEIDELDAGNASPMPTANVIGIILFLVAASAFAVFIVDMYWTAWTATAQEIVFPPLGIAALPVCAVFALMALEAGFRNFAGKPPPAWLFTASKYALVAIVAALIAGPFLLAPAMGSHLTEAGYTRTDEGLTGLDRRLWQKWEKLPAG